jgi:hypothetical protein
MWVLRQLVMCDQHSAAVGSSAKQPNVISSTTTAVSLTAVWRCISCCLSYVVGVAACADSQLIQVQVGAGQCWLCSSDELLVGADTHVILDTAAVAAVAAGALSGLMPTSSLVRRGAAASTCSA